MTEQKYVRINKGGSNVRYWLSGHGMSGTYLADQCDGNSGLEQDLAAGWRIKFCWEDCYHVVLLLER